MKLTRQEVVNGVVMRRLGKPLPLATEREWIDFLNEYSTYIETEESLRVRPGQNTFHNQAGQVCFQASKV